jgi:hypothetical protein
MGPFSEQEWMEEMAKQKTEGWSGEFQVGR